MPGSSGEAPEDQKRYERARFQIALNTDGNGSVISLINIIQGHAMRPNVLQEFIVTMTNTEGMTCLHQAVAFNDIELLKMIKERLFADIWVPFIKKKDKQKRTAFHWACVRCYKSIVNIMIESMQKSDIVALILDIDHTQLTVLHYVCENKFEDLEHILFQCVDGDDLRNLLEMKDKYKQTAFHLVCLSGHHKIVKMITQKVSPKFWDDIVLATDINGATSLHMACQYNHVETVTELLLSLSSCKVRKYLMIGNVNGKTAFNLLDIEPMQKIISNISRVLLVGEDQLQPGDQLRGEVSSQNKENPKKMPDMWLITALCQRNRFGNSSFHDKDLIEKNVNILNKYQEVYVDETSSLKESFPDFFYFCDNGIRFRCVVDFHPLSVLADAGHLELVMHPYIRIYTDALWKCFARYISYAVLTHQLLFLILISTFVTTHHIPVSTTVDHNVTDGVATMLYISKAPVVTATCRFCSIIMVFAGLFLELLQMITKRMGYIKCFENQLKLLICISTLIVTIVPLATCYNFWFHFLGTVTIMCVGRMVVLLISKMPTKFGYRCAMYSLVVRNVTIFSSVLCVPIVIFSLAFYNLLSHDQSFHPFEHSVMSIILMIVGELNNIRIFESAVEGELIGVKTETISVVLFYICFILFILVLIVLTMSGMSLLIGVAVQDINCIRAMGKIASFRSMVDLILQYSHSFRKFSNRKHRKTIGMVHGTKRTKQGAASFNDISKFENYCFGLESSYTSYYKKTDDNAKWKQILLYLHGQKPKNKAKIIETTCLHAKS